MIYFWKPRSTDSKQPMTPINVETVGRSNVDGIHNATVTFTTHGIVYSYVRLHHDKIFMAKGEAKEYQNYFTYYNMRPRGRLWRGKSWDGEVSNSALSLRAKIFANEAALMSNDMSDYESPPREETVNERDVAQLHAALDGLVSLFISLIKSTFSRVGLVWSSEEDYPLELRTAINLLRKQGGEIEGR